MPTVVIQEEPQDGARPAAVVTAYAVNHAHNRARRVCRRSVTGEVEGAAVCPDDIALTRPRESRECDGVAAQILRYPPSNGTAGWAQRQARQPVRLPAGANGRPPPGN